MSSHEPFMMMIMIMIMMTIDAKAMLGSQNMSKQNREHSLCPYVGDVVLRLGPTPAGDAARFTPGRAD